MAAMEEDEPEVYRCGSNPIGLVIYNPHGREGAEEEADDMQSGLEEAGFKVIRWEWTSKGDLVNVIKNALESISCCTLLFVCMMSHGSAGKLRAADGGMNINDLLYEFDRRLKENKLGTIPLVVVVQACQHEDTKNPPPTDCDMALKTTAEENTHLILNRPHSVLLMAAIRGRFAKRRVYTGALAAEFKRSNSKTDICEMHLRAATKISREFGDKFVPEMRTTLMKRLVFPGKTPPVPAPTSINPLHEIELDGLPITICNYGDQLFVGLNNKSIVRISAEYEVTLFIRLNSNIRGMAVCGDQLYTVTEGNSKNVRAHLLSTGEETVVSWTYRNMPIAFWGNNLAVIGEKVIIVGRRSTKTELSIYFKNGSPDRRLDCPQLSPDWFCIASAERDNLILSDLMTKKVHKISITTGDVIWTSSDPWSDVAQPIGVTCYNNQYVLVASRDKKKIKISILDTKTGELIRTLRDRTDMIDSLISISMNVSRHTLIVPRHEDRKLLYYLLE